MSVWVSALKDLCMTVICNHDFYYICLLLYTHRYILSGILGSIFLFNSGWEYVFLLVGVAGLTWCFVVYRLVKTQQQQTKYKLLENGDLKDRRSITAKKVDPSCAEVPWRLLLTQTPIM